MLEDFRTQLNNFFKDLDENIKDKEELLYVKQKTAEMVDFTINEIEKIMNYKEDKLNAIIKKQEQTDRIIQVLNDRMNDLYDDIYDEEPNNENEFQINCPYCGLEFGANIDENFNEIKCPECGNLIELDWNGNPDDEKDKGCGGNCSGCSGCK